MIQTINLGAGGTIRHVCSWGRPAAGTHSFKLLRASGGEAIDTGAAIVQTPPQTTVATPADQGAKSLDLAAPVASSWRTVQIQPAGTGSEVSPFAQSFKVGINPGDVATTIKLHEPLPFAVAVGDKVSVPEVAFTLSAVDAANHGAGDYLLEITALDDLGETHVEITRFAITTATVQQPTTYRSLLARYPLLTDRARVEDPEYARTLEVSLSLTLEALERIGFDWWDLRTWDQLDASVAARAYAHELASWGPDWVELSDKAEAKADSLLREVVDRLQWTDTNADGLPGDPVADLARVWARR